MARVVVDGKQFAVDGRRLPFRGVTYGTFEPRADGARFPDRDQMKRDVAAISQAGFTVVRTYTEPTGDLLDLAADEGLHVLAGLFYPDWRYLLGASGREQRAVARRARHEVGAAAERMAGVEHVLALCIGNEVPADVIRWCGTRTIAGALEALVDAAKDADPDHLVTYANYPTAEYLPLAGLDFLTFNVFLERQEDFKRYLSRLHHLAGDRPLVLGEMGLHAGSNAVEEARQAEVLAWQMATAVERGVAGWCVFSWTDDWWVGDARVTGWRFGLTRQDRSARPALRVAERWNERGVADLERRWPSISVVICARNAEETIDECLRHTCALEYPDLEIIVVDDGSTDATATIADRYSRAKVVRSAWGGLSAARNLGAELATGEIVAYLDSDAYPTPEWLWYLALAFDAPKVGAAGGPNLPPIGDGIGAKRVALAPGGPVHVLVGDDRAEHVPGCNLAIRRSVMGSVGGFDPVYRAAGDDVDLCWKVLDGGWEIGFHPAALVWHHRRSGLRAYLRQQRGYGKAEALVEARHPDRFNALGTARWRGRIYDSLVPSLASQRVYRGLFGAAPYQSVYRGGGHGLDIAHQLGLPLAALSLPTAPLALIHPAFGLPAAVAILLVVSLGVIDVRRVHAPPGLQRGRLRFRFSVAVLHLLQPLVRTWSRFRATGDARIDLAPPGPLPQPVTSVGRGVLLLPADGPRADIAARIVATLRRAGYRIARPTGWEDYDARFAASTLVVGEIVTSAHPEGSVQVRIRRRLHRRHTAAVLLAVAGMALVAPPLIGAIVAAAAADVAGGLWRVGPGARRQLRAMWSPHPSEI